MAERRMPQPGEIYRHFKDKLYQITTIAFDSETGEPMVVYQALYGDFKFYVRTLEMFLEKVDKEKYPDVYEMYRFELWQGLPKIAPRSINKLQDHVDKIKSEEVNQVQEQSENNPTEEAPAFVHNTEDINLLLMEFLDADSYTKKLNILSDNMEYINDRLINDMAVSLDCAVEEGPIESRISQLVSCLKAMSRFEVERTTKELSHLR